MPAAVRRTSLQAVLNGVAIDNVLSARWSFGYDQRVSECSVICATIPQSGGTRDLLGNLSGGTTLTSNYYDTLDIVAGAGTNNVLRFSGLLLQHDYTLWPRALTLTGKGRLQLVAEFENTVGDGVNLDNKPSLGGVALNGLTDQEMVAYVLNTAGSSISSDPFGSGTIGLTWGGGFIDGTGAVLGTMIMPDTLIGADLESGGPFVWKQGQTGLAFIEELDRVCLGFRLYEGSGGLLWRQQVFGRPNNTPIFTFTEGVDILEARTTRTIIPTRNRVRVSGYDYGLGLGPVSFTLQSSNPLQPADQWHTHELSSPMIERAQNSDPGTGLTCAGVATWQMAEVNRELVKTQLTTPLDLVINPGDTIAVLSPRLGGYLTPESYWVMRVDGQIDERGAFSQTLQLVSGGLPNDGLTPSWQ